MNLRKKVYQMFILGLSGENAENALAKGLGGIIFFSADIKSENQFKTLIKNLSENALIPPFLSIDQEGGRVERTENIHNGKKYLSQRFAFEQGEDFLKTQSSALVKELKSYGINLNFAPCIDVNTNPDNPIIGERAFSDNAQDVITGGKIVITEHLKNGVIPCAKHFPGHGDADKDSHLELPQINLSLHEMERVHIKPFAETVKCGVPAIMVAHLFCRCFGKEKIPTSLNPVAIKYLRQNLGFKGVIVSDDMVMKAISGADCAEKAIRAGVNLLIYRNSTRETINIIENIIKKAETDEDLRQKIEVSFEKIMSLKHAFKFL